MTSNTNKLPTTIENYRILDIQLGATPSEVKKAYIIASRKFHPNKVIFKNNSGKPRTPTVEEANQVKAKFTNIGAAYTRIMKSPLSPSKPALTGPGRNVTGEISAFKAKVINNFFRKNKPAKLVPGPNGNTTLAVVPANVKTNKPTLALTNVQGEPHKVIEAPAAVHEAVVNGKKLPAFVRKNTSYAGNGVGRANNTKASTNWNLPNPTGNNVKPSFWNRLRGIKRPSMPTIGRPSMPSFGFGGLFKSARQKAINAGNFIPRNTFNSGPRNGYEFKLNKYGQGYYRIGSFYTKNPIKGLPEMGPTAMGIRVPKAPNSGNGNNGPKNMITGNKAPNSGNKGPGGRGYGGGSTRVRTGNVRTGATRLGNVKSTSGSSRVEGVRGGSSQSEGGRGGTGGSISFAPVIKVNVPQAAAQSAVQALPAQERLALTNAGGYNNAAAAVSNAGGPATVERAINALNANGGNVNIAMQKTGLPRQVFNNVNRLGGPVTARRTLTAVKKVTVKTAPYVGQNATQRLAPNVYALAPVKKHRKKRRTEVKLAELNRVINAVKKKKLTSLVAHNVTRTNIHANENRLKSYYKRVIKAAILKKPFAKIARGHAKKLVLSAPAKKPRRKTPSTNNLSYV